MNQFKIGICDDERNMRYIIQEYIEDYFKSHEESCEILEYSDGKELLDLYEKLDILFLDIQMETVNGIETAKKIRKFDDNVCIIFITALPEYAKEGYKVKAFRYLTKPIECEEFMLEISEAINEINCYKNKQITVKNDAGLFLIEQNDIIYIEVKSRKAWIQTVNENIFSYETLKTFEEMLDKTCFYRCHQGYIINLKYVESVTNENIIKIRRNFNIPLSKHRKKELMRKLTIYLGAIL